MNDKLSKRLELLVDDFADEQGNWSAVLRDAGYDPAAESALPRFRGRTILSRLFTQRRRTVRVALAAAVAAAAVLVGVSIIPGGGGCGGSVLACASAAIKSDGEVVHMVVLVPGPGATPQDVYDTRYETWYDVKTGETHSNLSGPEGASESWTVANGDRYSRCDSGEQPRCDGVVRRYGNAKDDGPDLFDPLFRFFGTYEEQLRNGTARLAGTTTFDGRRAYMIDFRASDEVGPNGKVSQTAVRVLVDANSYEPVGAGVAEFGIRWIPFIPRVKKTTDGGVVPDEDFKVDVWMKILSAEFTEKTPGMYDVPTA